MTLFGNWRTRVGGALAVVVATAGLTIVGGQGSAQAETSGGTQSATTQSATSALDCPEPILWTPYALWGDYRLFYALPGGDFESYGAWRLGAGAWIASGNSTVFINLDSANKKSLRLSSGSTTTATFTCVPASLDFTFYIKSPTNAPNSAITVTAQATDPTTGRTATTSNTYNAVQPYLPVGTWVQAWPTPMPDVVDLNSTSSLQTVKLTFSVSGGGTWGVDDILMDPWRSYR